MAAIERMLRELEDLPMQIKQENVTIATVGFKLGGIKADLGRTKARMMYLLKDETLEEPDPKAPASDPDRMRLIKKYPNEIQREYEARERLKENKEYTELKIQRDDLENTLSMAKIELEYFKNIFSSRRNIIKLLGVAANGLPELRLTIDDYETKDLFKAFDDRGIEYNRPLG